MKEVIKTVTFDKVAIGQHFVANGTRWIKRSTRTASVVTTSEPIFYFGKGELVQIAAPATN